MSTEYALVRARALRFTKLDACGNPDPGPKNAVITKGVISLGLEPVNVEGDSIAVTNANGDRCITDDAIPAFDHWALTLNLCGVNPYLINLATGQPMVTNEDDEVVGYGVDSGIDLSTVALAIELWSKIPANLCVSGQQEWGYSLVPFSSGGTVGGLSFENAAINGSITGLISKPGTNWGVGPWDVRRNSTTGVAGPLREALPETRHFHQEKTTLGPPTPVDGAVALGIPATGATAGAPGAFTPSNSYGPEDLSGMTGVTASPSTAWTAGQYVPTEGGDHVKWNGSAWVSA